MNRRIFLSDDAGDADGVVPDESAILHDDVISEKDCPTEFSVDDDRNTYAIDGQPKVSAPIVGYETMEERSRFTVRSRFLSGYPLLELAE